MKKKLLIVMAVIAAVLMLTACSKSGSSSEATTSASEPAKSTSSPVTVELWSSLSGTKANVFDKQVAAFNESQSDIIVNVIHQGGYTILRQKVAAAANAHNLPDMLICDYIDVPYYAQLGLLSSLEGLLSDDLIADYYPSMLIDLKYDGELYAIPYNRSTQGFYVNNDLLREAGIDRVASTWDEFLEDAKKIKSLGDNYYYGYSFFNQFIFDAIAYSWGAEISTQDGEVLLNSPEIVDLMTYFQQMNNDGLLLMPPALVGGFEELNGAFLDGHVATVFQTSSFAPTAESLLDCDWSFEFIPAGDGGHAITIGGGNLAITSGVTETEKQACLKFFEFMSSPEIVKEFFMETKNLPVRMSILEEQDVKDYLAANPAYQKMLDQLEYGRPVPSVTKNILDVFNRVNDMMSRIILNNEDAKTVLDEYTALFQSEIDEAKSFGEFIY